ncbi:CDP-alcohol phosphatidyltransferase family protein [Streptomyces antimycoticus]|uniref:CDP-alcohol phosphatidyltransferase family protein n=1 Tax=Streptomyces mordarskii TaxID=1226758 RepID=A0ABN1CGM4_9ACTN|nr:CDP-alcohol phosphatidyltransferase family protein [Streptomyces antimycoticus]WTB06894.1 CDP-alcohol phosphatidyltransferase family protein [Streptomyces antimycoticus]
MNGLYALKPWFARRLTLLRRWLIRSGISPNAVTFAGVLCAGAAAASFAMLAAPWAVVPVVVFLTARLACANLDGSIARETGKQTRLGSLLNEIGDRAADLVVILGFLPHLSPPFVLGALLASSAPSWISIAGAAAGVRRINGGPMGKTERCLVVAVAAASGWYAPAAVVMVVGSALTAGVRLFQVVALCNRRDGEGGHDGESGRVGEDRDHDPLSGRL